jgi:hypothetical protein
VIETLGAVLKDAKHLPCFVVSWYEDIFAKGFFLPTVTDKSGRKMLHKSHDINMTACL